LSDFELKYKVKTLDYGTYTYSHFCFRGKPVGPENAGLEGLDQTIQKGWPSGQLNRLAPFVGKRVSYVTIDGKDIAREVEELGTSNEFAGLMKPTEWKEFGVVAVGKNLQFVCNGKHILEVIDERPSTAACGSILTPALLPPVAPAPSSRPRAA
jgi:hypothetical protein